MKNRILISLEEKDDKNKNKLFSLLKKNRKVRKIKFLKEENGITDFIAEKDGIYKFKESFLIVDNEENVDLERIAKFSKENNVTVFVNFEDETNVEDIHFVNGEKKVGKIDSDVF